MEHSLTSLEEKFKTLPPDVQRAITSVDIARQLTDIGKKHHLHVDQLDELFDEAGLVMLGLTKPHDLIRNLRKRVSISDEDARNVVREIDAQIFSPIRESLKKIHGINDASVDEEELSDEEQGLSREEILRDIEDKEEDESRIMNNELQGRRNNVITSIQNPTLTTPAPHELVALEKTSPPLPQKSSQGEGTLANRIQDILKGAPGAIHYPDISPKAGPTEESAPVVAALAETTPQATPAVVQEVPYKEKFEKVVSSAPKETIASGKQAASDGMDPYREPLP